MQLFAGTASSCSRPQNAQPAGIVAAPDGNLWFTESNVGRVARITPDGSVTEFTVGTANDAPTSITVGPDGNLWFADYGADRLGKITLLGASTLYSPLPTLNSGTFDVVSGPDRNLWFTELEGRIGVFEP